MHPLKQFLDRTGLSAAQLATLAGTSRQTLHRIQTGKQTPSLGLVDRLCKATHGELKADDFLPSRRRAG